MVHLHIGYILVYSLTNVFLEHAHTVLLGNTQFLAYHIQIDLITVIVVYIFKRLGYFFVCRYLWNYSKNEEISDITSKPEISIFYDLIGVSTVIAITWPYSREGRKGGSNHDLQLHITQH